MTYSEPMKWAEAEAVILERMRAQPRGYAQQLATTLGCTRSFISHMLNGRRPIPLEHLDAILESLGMTYQVVLDESHSPRPR